MSKAYERKTPFLPHRIYMIDGDGHYYSMYNGYCSFTKDVPDYTCEVLVEYLSNDPEQFYLRSWEGTYFEYYSGQAYIDPTIRKDIVPGTTIPFTVLDIDANDNTFAFRASNGKFIVPQAVKVDHKDRPYLPLADFHSATIKVAEPIIKRVFSDFNYDTDSSKITEWTPEVALSTEVRNDSDSNNFTQTLMYSYLASTIGTWSNTVGGSFALKTTIEAAVIPKFFGGKVETTVTINGSHTWGGSETKTKTVTSTSTIAVPPKRKGVATILVKKATIDVPFTYLETTWYKNGGVTKDTKKGIYNNVESYRVDVQISEGWTSI